MQSIIKIYDKYIIWSSIVDAPVTRGMTLEELTAYVFEWYGRNGLESLPAKLRQVEEKGTSRFIDMSAAETVAGNRAGENAQELTLEEIYEAYCT